MNEERKWRQVEHTRGHLWHRYLSYRLPLVLYYMFGINTLWAKIQSNHTMYFEFLQSNFKMCFITSQTSLVQQSLLVHFDFYMCTTFLGTNTFNNRTLSTIMATQICIHHCSSYMYVGLLVTWRVPNVEQEILTLPDHLRSLPVFSRVPVAQSLVFCVVFCR